jgi:osmoprotectant transport system permease protein
MTLSLVLDQLIAVIEKSIQSRRKISLILASCAIVALVGIGVVPGVIGPESAGFSKLQEQGNDFAGSDKGDVSRTSLDGQVIRIGAKGFTEQFILAEILRKKIEDAGGTPEVLSNMGSTIVFDALAKNTVDVYIGYTGTIWSTVLKETDPIGRTAMRATVAGRLYDEYGIVLAGALGFENTYALVAKSQTLQRYNLRQIGDLTPIAEDLKIGGDPEFFGRPEWQRVRRLYSLTDITEVGMDSTFMYQAVADGQVDVAAGFSTDGRIDAFDLDVLDDPKGAFPPYDAVLLLSPQAAKNKDLVHALEPLLNRISVSAMRDANRQVDEDGVTPKEAASKLLKHETTGSPLSR